MSKARIISEIITNICFNILLFRFIIDIISLLFQSRLDSNLNCDIYIMGIGL